jgi:hypothetical protein
MHLVNLGLEEAATVKSNVKKQPRGGTGEEINTVATEELLGEEGIRRWILLQIYEIIFGYLAN